MAEKFNVRELVPGLGNMTSLSAITAEYPKPGYRSTAGPNWEHFRSGLANIPK